MKPVWIAVFALVLVLALLLRHPSSPVSSSTAAAEATASATPGRAPASTALDRPPPSSAVRPAKADSLQGSQPDGAIHLDFAGRLQPDLALRHRFDYYLGLIGEQPLTAIRQRLLADLAGQGLAASVRAEVSQDFERYLRLQRASAALAATPSVSLLQRLRQLRQLRQEVLGEVLAQAFFGADEARESRQQASLEIALDPSLSAAEKQSRLAALDRAAIDADPALERQSIALQVEQLSATLDQDDADDADRYQQRATRWGAAAADRLAALDRQRRQWQQRVQAYRQASAAWPTDPGQAARRRQWLDQHFSPQEQLRLSALSTAGP